ncbi:MAG: outer membrane protein assembly factor BamE [Geminicoccaceae bacterium]|jgi:outer membrane protein assembly factor BamE (lipoprotein component of BamABCDE complex)|nr:MAG: outer membrane protein assembly factor BamE [Geminicoccaceae bacterium]
MSRFARLAGVPALALVVLAACSPTISNHGHRLDTTRLEQIRPGVTSREEVRRLLGSPSTMATLDDGTWYYVAQRTERANFYSERLVEQEVVAIRFDARGIVERIDRNGLESAQAVVPVADKTPTRGNELTLLEQVVSNIGRFNTPTDPLTRRQGQPPF